MTPAARPAAARPAGPMARRVRGRRRRDLVRLVGARAVSGLGLLLVGGIALASLARGAAPAAAGTLGNVAAATAAPVASPVPATAAAFGGDLLAASAGPDPLDLILKGGLVLALLYVTLRVLRRVQGSPGARGGALQVLESRPLAAKASLHLVAVGERRLVVGLSAAGLVALGELDAAELAESATADAGADASHADLRVDPRAPMPGALPSALPTVAGALPAALRPACSAALAALRGRLPAGVAAPVAAATRTLPRP